MHLHHLLAVNLETHGPAYCKSDKQCRAGGEGRRGGVGRGGEDGGKGRGGEEGGENRGEREIFTGIKWSKERAGSRVSEGQKRERLE